MLRDYNLTDRQKGTLYRKLLSPSSININKIIKEYDYLFSKEDKEDIEQFILAVRDKVEAMVMERIL